jgi:dolichol-phosphate mannosyltransferase
MDESSLTLVIIPTFQERENIKQLVDKILQLEAELNVLVVDDNSPDGTAGLVRSEYDGNSNVALIVRPKKLGLGTAYVAGFRYAIAHQYPFALTMDADLSHNPTVILEMLQNVKDVDIVIGSRYVRGGAIAGDWGALRKLISRTANLLAHTFLSLKPADCTSGFRLYRTAALVKIGFESITSNGYSFLIEILHRAARHHLRIAEVPILFIDRRFGKSKISTIEIFKTISTMLRLRFQ